FIRSIINDRETASHYCKELGGTLATVNSDDATQCLIELTKGLNWRRLASAWIGLTDPLKNASHTARSPWAWDDGTPYNYSNWHAGGECTTGPADEPNNCDKNEWCVDVRLASDRKGTWNDDQCNSDYSRNAFCSKRL
ncbi:C-type lectin 13, partial [Aphelenchoides avenae]